MLSAIGANKNKTKIEQPSVVLMKTRSKSRNEHPNLVLTRTQHGSGSGSANDAVHLIHNRPVVEVDPELQLH